MPTSRTLEFPGLYREFIDSGYLGSLDGVRHPNAYEEGRNQGRINYRLVLEAEQRDAIKTFIGERDWEQSHSPKNLAMALSVEAAEVVEHFQWLTEEQSIILPPEKLAEVREEIGDVRIYLTELAEKLGRPGRGRQSER